MNGTLFDQGSDRTAPATDEKVSWVREAAGARFDDIELQILTAAVEVTQDRKRGAEKIAAKAGITASDVIGAPSYLIGTTDQVRDDLKECRAVWGFSYIVLGEESYEAMAPVVEDLAGS